MSIFCFLKKEARITLSLNGTCRVHAPTDLDVGTEARGNYIRIEHDLFQEPDLVIRDDLADDIEWFSAKIDVDMPVYTRKELQTGNYDVGDPEVRLVVSRKIENSHGVLFREMTVRAPTLAKIKETIRKIRRGEITPAGREQTILELTEIAAAGVEGTNRMLSGEVQRLTKALVTAESLNVEQKSVMDGILLYLEGRTEHVWQGNSTDNRYRDLQDKIVFTRSALKELIALKATRWYKIGRFFSDLINFRRDLRS
jgi:hypothetical protein